MFNVLMRLAVLNAGGENTTVLRSKTGSRGHLQDACHTQSQLQRARCQTKVSASNNNKIDMNSLNSLIPLAFSML
jgi:hypothetical protein